MDQARTGVATSAILGRPRGRPRRGSRVETKLTSGEVARVEELIGHLGRDRSEVLATLIRRALAELDG